MNDLEIITTSDGSHSLLNRTLNETYHSHHGAVQESMHVFIEHGFKYSLNRGLSPINIFEVGFGTGLNAWLTLNAARSNGVPVRYTTIELYPLEKEIWSQLNYAPSNADFLNLHGCEWEKEFRLNDHFTLQKLRTSLQDVPLSGEHYDVVYFDAFAPNKQPEMWALPLLQKVVVAMKRPGIFVTYCAKGQLKRDLKSLELEVETLAGPPGKKEMVRALKK